MRAVLLMMITAACSYPQLTPVGDNGDAPSAPPLSLDDAGPVLLYEGQGTGGSRQVVLAITGQNFTPAAIVRVFATGSETPMIMVNNNDPMIASRISAANDVLAVSVTLPVDLTLPASPDSAMQDVPLTIEVTQPAGGAMVTKTLTGKVTLRTLPELTADTAAGTSIQLMYSLVDVPRPLSFTTAQARLLIRSASAIRLQAVTASAVGQSPGPGGAAGGAPGSPGGGISGGGAGNSLAGGGGGGLATAGNNGSGMGGIIPGGAPNGDPLISDYTTGNVSAGGGGGQVPGGGGGGTIELTAAGDVHVSAITANGGAGANAGLGAPGGGGAGGIIVIRAGGTATLDGTISATGGAAGTGSIGLAGAGSTGRTRIDAPAISLAATATPPYHRGASWDPATPFTTKTSPLSMKLFGSVADKFDVIVLDGAGGASSPALTANFGNVTMITVRPTLQPGFNRVCVTRNGGSVTVIEATNCIDVAYLP